MTYYMKFTNSWFVTINRLCRRIDPFSLQFRLTIGVAAVLVAGLGSVALFTSWKMQQQLIQTHKKNIQYIADRFPRDVEIYSKQLPLEVGLRRTVSDITAPNLLVWVESNNGKIVAESVVFEQQDRNVRAKLRSISNASMIPQVYGINDLYLALCRGPLVVKDQSLGMLYVAQDITYDQRMLLEVVKSLLAATLLAIASMTVTIAIYIKRSLQPVRQISQHARAICAEDLGNARVQLDRAPTEVKELAQTLDLMLSRLSESWENQRQFVSNVSHELRTPLTIVNGYLQSTLRRGSNLTEPQREALAVASAEADRTIQLLQDLLDLARADSGHIHFHLEPVALKDLVSEVAAMAQQYSNREIAIETTEEPIIVKADPNRLKQVLLNLIDNAVKYSQADTPISLRLHRSATEAFIQVTDQGYGIPLAHQSRIFDRFYRVDEARARSTGGTGLGLSIVKTLVEGMGGQVTVRSKIGEGSVFTVILPASLLA